MSKSIVLSLLIASIGLWCALQLVTPEFLWALVPSENLDKKIFFELQLPRVLNAFCVGGLLALAGCFLQSLLNNPLADPYILGISGGASAGMLVAHLLALSVFLAPALALGFAMLTALIIFHLAYSQGFSKHKLLLAGIMMSAGWSAVISFLMVVASEHQLKTALFWLMGAVSYTPSVWVGTVALSFGLMLALLFAKGMNLLHLGEIKAKSLGVSTERLSLGLFVVCVIMTTVAVLIAGNIGFVGLVVPNLVRFWFGANNRAILPVSLACGGVLVAMADSVSRVFLSPVQLPVGVMMAMLGVPFFLLVLIKKRAL